MGKSGDNPSHQQGGHSDRANTKSHWTLSTQEKLPQSQRRSQVSITPPPPPQAHFICLLMPINLYQIYIYSTGIMQQWYSPMVPRQSQSCAGLSTFMIAWVTLGINNNPFSYTAPYLPSKPYLSAYQVATQWARYHQCTLAYIQWVFFACYQPNFGGRNNVILYFVFLQADPCV